MAMRKPSEAPVEVGTTRTHEDVAPRVMSYEENKNRRILVQGITQACASSPSTINFGTEPAEVTAKIKEMALDLISFVNNQCA